jgi:N-acetylneuraminate synthase
MKTYIIAEAGVNHNGDIKIAKRLIDVARHAGVDAVKFQSFKTDISVSPAAEKSEYQKKGTLKDESFYEMMKRLELGLNEHVELINYAQKKGITFLSTPSDKESVDLLEKLRVPIFKISSGNINNLPLLEHVARKGKPIILSTGRSTMKEVEEAVNTIFKSGNKEISLLHCVSVYPASFEDLNLRAINTLKKAFGLPVGFSDHTLGIEASVAAVALGAQIIEKHFTLSRTLPGPDHRSSLETAELKSLVTAIRHIESALGDGRKRPARAELTGRRNVRRGLVASVFIPRGTKIKEEMIAIKRPAEGVEPKYLNRIIGKKTTRDIKKETPIKKAMVDGMK